MMYEPTRHNFKAEPSVFFNQPRYDAHHLVIQSSSHRACLDSRWKGRNCMAPFSGWALVVPYDDGSCFVSLREIKGRRQTPNFLFI